MKIKQMPELSIQQIKKFWASADLKPTNECWIWQKAILKKYGYGVCTIKGIAFRASRISYFLYYKEDAGNLFVLHTCDNRACVNPHHLFKGTAQDNTDDMMSKGRLKITLTKQDADNIRILYKQGDTSLSKLAAIYKVSPPCISQIINNHRWKQKRNR